MLKSFAYSSKNILIEKTEINHTWAKYTAPAVANQGSSTPLFSLPGKNGGNAKSPTGIPVIAAPHQAAFQNIYSAPKNAPIGPAGIVNAGRYSPHLR